MVARPLLLSPRQLPSDSTNFSGFLTPEPRISTSALPSSRVPAPGGPPEAKAPAWCAHPASAPSLSPGAAGLAAGSPGAGGACCPETNVLPRQTGSLGHRGGAAWEPEPGVGAGWGGAPVARGLGPREPSELPKFDKPGLQSAHFKSTSLQCLHIKIMNIKDPCPTSPRLGWGFHSPSPFGPSCLTHLPAS